MSLISVFIVLASSCSCNAFRATLPSARGSSISTFELETSSSANNIDGDQLRQTASKLRSEAKAAEEALKESRGVTAKSQAAINFVEPAEYLDLKDSCWEITFRFANEPASKDDSENDSKNKLPRKSYGGKLELKFREDGYTDALPSDADISSSPRFQKLWGWDRETSTEDSLEYLLFSADISLPPPISTSERFYFQARVDREQRNEEVISLKDGSITVKRNIDSPAGGWWGIFRGADSILAQFRQVGNFRCRPISAVRGKVVR